MTYVIGCGLRFTASFVDDKNEPTDPECVIFRVRRGSHPEDKYTYGSDQKIAKPSPGIYYIDLVLDAVGTWRYRWEGSGTLNVAAEQSFNVPKSILI